MTTFDRVVVTTDFHGGADKPAHLDADLVFDGEGRGPVIAAPDGTQYRLVVANDGTLTTEAAG